MRIAVVSPRIALLPAVALVALLAGASPARTAELGERLDRALDSRALRGARTAALVVDRRTGEVRYARDPDRPLVPASNQKILTAIAALSAFGPTHHFVTDLFTSAPLDDAGGAEVLYVRGAGDPALTNEDFGRLAMELRRAGLRRVRGGLVLDVGALEAARWHPSWGRTGARAYHAPVGALTANYGAFSVSVTPGSQAGEAVEVLIDPPVPYLRLVNRAVTAPPRAGSTLEVDRRAGEGVEEVVVSGAVPQGTPEKAYYRSVLDPARYAGAVLRRELELADIRVEGETRLGAVPADATPLLAFEGKPLAEIVRLFMKYSNNAVAETLVKDLGLLRSEAPGSWRSGLPALKAELSGLGVDTDGLVLVDGSGLSYENRATPRALVEALRVADASFRFGPELVAALPIAGGDGTLERRAEEAAFEIRAKTGLLTRVTSLSGFAEGPDGSEFVFSVLTNGYRGGDGRAMAALDGFVAALVEPPPTSD